MIKSSRNMRSLRGSKGGQMPFAIIAVTILLLGSAYGVVAYQMEKCEENTDNITSELDSLGVAINNTETFVNTGLGEIIYDVSTDPNGGTIDDRISTYKERAKKWMDFQFPLIDGSVRASLVSFETDLSAVALKLTTDDEFTDGYSPSYLKGTGSFTADYSCDSGRSTTTSEINSDSSCALPLIAEQGSLFENAITGSGSVLAQMISYQLTAIAQYRVLNGYGTLSAYGDMGTMSIITKEDVNKAYENSMDVISALYFRSADDETLVKATQVDLADMMISGNKVEIDLSALYSQAVVSVMDDLSLKWLDYLYFNKVLNLKELVSDTLSRGWNSLVGFLTGTNRFTAEPYIKGVMEENGYSENEYRYLLSGKTFDITVPGSTIDIGIEEPEIVEIAQSSITVNYPSVDMMSYGGISDFKKHYENNTNEMRNWFVSVINTAAFNIGQNKMLGTIKLPLNATDDSPLLETISNTVNTALTDGNAVFERAMESALGNTFLVDPFYAAIFEEINNNSEEIFKVDSVKPIIRATLYESLSSQISEDGTLLNDSGINALVDRIMSGQEVEDIVEGYKDAIRNNVMKFDRLNDVPNGQPGLIKRILVAIFTCSNSWNDPKIDISGRIIGLCQEMYEHAKINAYSDIVDLPDDDRFEFTDNAGNKVTEYLSLDKTMKPKIAVHSPNSYLEDCIHYVGFNEDTGASYCTTFGVSIKDTVNYNVSSANTLVNTLGLKDTSLKGTAEINISVKISVASGWSLMGVSDYQASNTLLGDAWNLLVKALEPLIKPLRQIMSMIMDVLSVFSSALIKVAKFVATVVESIYMALIEPLEQLKIFIEDLIQGVMNYVLEAILNAVNFIIDITASEQAVGISFMGFTIMLSTKASSWINNTKTLLTVSIGCDFDFLELEGSMTIKQKGSGADKDMIITGGFRIGGNGWNIEADIDPSMKSTKYMISINGKVKGVEFDIVLPKLVQYKEIEFSLTDAPGLGTVLSNIPTPIPGVKAAIDAGINIKYNLPFENSLVINEIELNPEGTDTGYEWAELYNASTKTIDLEGYTLTAGSDPKKKIYTISGLELGPGGRTVITFPGAFLNNAGSGLLKGGECLILKDASGEQIDKTSIFKDSSNSSYTWQRIADAASDWTFAEGTPDSGNCGGLLSGNMVQAQIIKVLKNAAVDTLSEMGGSLLSTGDLSEFFKTMMQKAIDNAIEMIANCLVEASIFVSLELKDATSTVCAGFRVALSINSGFLEQGLKCLVGEIESILFNIENPYGLTPKYVLTDNLWLGVTIYFGLTCPSFLKDLDSYPKIKLGVNIATNISGLSRLVGNSMGSWGVTAGVVIMDCPTPLIPSALEAQKGLESDLWLLYANFRAAAS